MCWHLTGHKQAVKESLMYRRGSIYVPEFSPIFPKPRYTAAQPSHDAGLAPMRTSARVPCAKDLKRLKENDSCRTLRGHIATQALVDIEMSRCGLSKSGPC
ncbi:hypothetical protein FQN52_001576 [Onygenales sp. PD_12]|nr:hypothetical protein FQN52_001576 [Onygenales sp. PD_12]